VPKTEPDTTATTSYIDIAGQVESLGQSDIKPIGKTYTKAFSWPIECYPSFMSFGINHFPAFP
jgi:hypothetical protein